HLGIGASLAFSLTGNAFVFLQTNNAKASTMRFAASIKPKLAPYFGLYYGTGDTEPSDVTAPTEGEAFSGGLVVRLPVSYGNVLDLLSGANAFGDFAALDFGFTARAAMFYDPLTVELGFSLKHSETFRTYVQADYQDWYNFEAPALNITNPEITNCGDSGGGSCTGIQIQPSDNPIRPARDIVVGRAGEEITIGENTFRVGYSFRPGIFRGDNSGAGNSLDPDRHSVNLGWGRVFPHFLGFETPFRLDLNFQYQKLISQTVTKTSGDETGNLAENKIGSPGYSAGGELWGGGMSVSLAF
ncbi:MAG TPA: hypothetical protein VL588_02625, partial [Bdellovibrionota bacterium]|nr:hypothetical protein [Bdellovibrionota bacterium]